MLRQFYYQRRGAHRLGESPWSPAAGDGPPNPKNGTYSPVIELTEEDRNLPLSVLFWVYPPPDWTRGSALDVVTFDALRAHLHDVLHGPRGAELKAALQNALATLGYKKVTEAQTPRSRLRLLFEFARCAAVGGEGASHLFDRVVLGFFPAAPPPEPDDLIAGADLPEPNRASGRVVP